MAKTDKTCIICGVIFKGTAKAQVCGPTCRQRLKRGTKPTFKLVADFQKKQQEKKKITTKNYNFIPPPGLGKVEALRWLRERNPGK